MSYDYWPKGHMSDELYLNVANGNAAVPAQMMGVSFGEREIPVEGLEQALANVKAQCEADYMSPTIVNGNVTYCGRSWEQIQWYKKALTELLEYCIKHKVPLLWG